MNSAVTATVHAPYSTLPFCRKINQILQQHHLTASPDFVEKQKAKETDSVEVQWLISKAFVL
jgi:hypothetical protein